nr:uncharacterized protein LOC109166477 [Ipomoea batatas]
MAMKFRQQASMRPAVSQSGEERERHRQPLASNTSGLLLPLASWSTTASSNNNGVLAVVSGCRLGNQQHGEASPASFLSDGNDDVRWSSMMRLRQYAAAVAPGKASRRQRREASVQNYDVLTSDHTAIFVEFEGPKHARRRECLTRRLDHCGVALKHWGGGFGKRTQSEIENIHRCLNSLRERGDVNGLAMFRNLDAKLRDLYDSLNTYWRQRAKQH